MHVRPVSDNWSSMPPCCGTAGSINPVMLVGDTVFSWAMAALTATTVTVSIVAVGIEPRCTATYDCAAISAVAELLSDFVQEK